MIRIALGIVVAGLLAGAVVPAGAETPESGPTDRNIIQILVPQLGAEAFARRQAAEQKLIDLGEEFPEVVPALHRHADAWAHDAEVSMRLKRIIRTIELLAKPGGEIVNGLKYVLEADGPLLSFDQPITLTTTIINTTDKDLTVRVGYSTGGNYFTSGSAVRVERPADAKTPDGKRAVERPQSRVKFCGTGAYPINTIIEAGRSVSYQTKLRLIRLDHAEADEAGRCPIAIYAGNGYPFLTGAEQTMRLFTTLSVSKQNARAGGMSPEQVVANGRYWHGDIRSNAVEVTIDRDGKPDDRSSGR